MLYLCLLALLAGQAFARSTKIVGGTDANIRDHPHQGSLRLRDSHSCGCSLIKSTWVVTAAHCVGGAASSYSVKLGSTSRTDANGQIIDVASITDHPDYNQGPGAYPNDIAVLLLASAPASDPNIATIGLSSSNYEGQKGTITGWGRTCGSCPLPDTLQKAQIDIYTRAECETVWGSNINDGHVCVGDTNSGRGSCNGDSGGPLEAHNMLVGATSWGASGCSTSYPSVYTSVAYFRDWINANSR